MVLEPQQQWRDVRFDDIANRTVKAEGAGAIVYHGFLPSSATDEKALSVALRKPRIISSAALLRFEAELALRSRLSHENVLPLLAACSTPPDYCTLSPWMHGGTLFDLIHKRSVGMSFKRIVLLTLQLAKAMAYMHGKNLVHRDVKTANILLDHTWENLMVADLDLAVDVNQLHTNASANGGRALYRGPSNGRLSHMVGTLVYMAPEVLSGSPHSFAADVYAFGITANEMATAAVPFLDRKMPVPELHTVLETRFNEIRLRSAIVKNHLRPALATGVSPAFANLTESCWKHNADERPSFETIVKGLQEMLDQGREHLTKYAGSTLQTRGSAGNQFCDSDSQNIFEEIVQAAKNPPKPIWTKRFDVVPADRPPGKSLTISSGLCSTAGPRGKDSMEDRSVILHELGGLADTHLFAVLDGHAGQACSEFAAQHVAGAIFQAWKNQEATPESALVHAFEDVDHAFLNSTPSTEGSGCTALAALMIGQKIYVANAGDCRCVLGKADGTAVELSTDHVATDPAEKARIKARGGAVVTGRVQGCLIVSRAMGDRSLKRFVTATPEVITHEICDDDDFLILASDGIWDVISSGEAVSMVKSTARVPDLCAKRLLGAAMDKGSDDNASVIVVLLRGQDSFRRIVG